MITESFIRNLADECLLESTSYLLDLKIKAGNVIQVTIDSDTLVGINDCVGNLAGILNRILIGKPRILSCRFHQPVLMLRCVYPGNTGKTWAGIWQLSLQMKK